MPYIFYPFSKKTSTINVKFCFYLCFFISICTAQTVQYDQNEINFYQSKGIQPFISSEQDGEYPGGTYLVLHDLTIEKGKIMTLNSGTTLLFTKDSRLTVNGILLCQGKNDNPIKFEKLDDSSYYKHPDSSNDMNWDGIYVSDSATLSMKCTEINNSKFGIVAQPHAASISLDSVEFNNNKYHSVRFGSDLPDIADKKMFSVFWSGFDTSKAQIQLSDTLNRQITSKITTTNSEKSALTTKPASGKRGIRLLTGSASIIGIALGITGYYFTNHYNSLIDKSNPDKSGDPSVIATTDPKTVKRYTDKAQKGQWMAVSGDILGSIGITGFLLTFVF